VSLNHTQQLSISKIVKWEIVSTSNVASIISKMGFVLWVLLVKLQTLAFSSFLKGNGSKCDNEVDQSGWLGFYFYLNYSLGVHD
jgi:hypothetical protein